MHPVVKATGYPARAGRFAATQARGRLPPTEIKYYYERRMMEILPSPEKKLL